ncbi:hypothetical protein [Breoghania sp.]|uniref:hypothetical protein n=1 Tax=Breoghania sp. TaxID=2065378 RepID=UPI002AA926AE|nr:hypothetical protein [Breoghania sp.]
MDTLEAMLASPDAAVDLDEFARQLFIQRVRLRLSGAAEAAADPALPGRIRGAFGEALKHTASAEAIAGTPCPWSPPCAFDALFRNKGRMTPGTDYPNPWVIGVDPEGRDLIVTLSVFGLACEWLPAAMELFTDAVRNRLVWPTARSGNSPSHHPNRGRGLRSRMENIAPPALVDRQVETQQGLEPQNDPGLALNNSFNPRNLGRSLAFLDFISPVTVSGRDLLGEPEAIFAAAGLRLEGIARWHGLSLKGAVNWQAMRGAVEALDFAWHDAFPLTWNRRSNRQSRTIRMRGVVGGLTIRMPEELALASGATRPDAPDTLPRPDQLQAFSTLLEIGSAIHLGSDIAFGCGRYVLTQR